MNSTITPNKLIKTLSNMQEVLDILKYSLKIIMGKTIWIIHSKQSISEGVNFINDQVSELIYKLIKNKPIIKRFIHQLNSRQFIKAYRYINRSTNIRELLDEIYIGRDETYVPPRKIYNTLLNAIDDTFQMFTD